MKKEIIKIISVAKQNIKARLNMNIALIATEHFQIRLIERFQEEDLPRLERAVEKAFEKATAGSKITYTHPAYDITVVGKKIGINGMELITCWQGDANE